MVRERRVTKDTKIRTNGSELSMTYTIEDVSHAEPMSEHEFLRDAIAELERLTQISWN